MGKKILNTEKTDKKRRDEDFKTGFVRGNKSIVEFKDEGEDRKREVL